MLRRGEKPPPNRVQTKERGTIIKLDAVDSAWMPAKYLDDRAASRSPTPVSGKQPSKSITIRATGIDRERVPREGLARALVAILFDGINDNRGSWIQPTDSKTARHRVGRRNGGVNSAGGFVVSGTRSTKPRAIFDGARDNLRSRS